jgi:hypothetical protein
MNMFYRFALAGLIAALSSSAARADTFDRYTNQVLSKAPGADGVKELKQVSGQVLNDNARVLPGVNGCLLMVRTREGRYAKLLVEKARQKIAGTVVPILVISRFVTYREGQERATQASGQNLVLFGGFHVDLDIGQVVPPALGGDVRLVAEGDKTALEPLGRAKLYVVTRPLAAAAAHRGTAPTHGERFDPRFFNGSYKLYDDGRRSGKLTLKVAEDGSVAGAYYSSKDGLKYDVEGKIGTPLQTVEFTIRFPRSAQAFRGWLFTGDGKALTGYSNLQNRERGFYALREEESD